MQNQIGVFVAIQSVFLRCFGRCFCGISSGVFVVNAEALHFLRPELQISIKI
jgi:hypothetical protein